MNRKTSWISGLLAALAVLALASQLHAAGDFSQPSITDRTSWGARAPQCSISQMGGLDRAVIHHTAIASDYDTTSLEDSKAKVRAIQNYHMDSNGWCDIGYHFLVDKLGNRFEGREGSIASLPRGAHDGVNSNSMGFNVMGYFHTPYDQQPTTEQRSSLYDLIAWKIPDPFTGFGSSTYGGSTTGYIAGHRDVGATACPGDLMYQYIGTNFQSGEARLEVNDRITGSSPSTTIVVDNDDGSPVYTETGTWATSGSTGYNGGTYRFATVGAAHTATWTANLDAGEYQVDVIYRAGTNRATSTKYDIVTAGGTETVYIDQTVNDLAWVQLGTYIFSAGDATVTLDSAGSSGNSVVIADAVQFTLITAEPTPTPTPSPSPTPSATPTPTPSPSPSPTASPSPTIAPPADTIVDNDDGSPAYTESGLWATSGSAGYNGGTYRYATVGAANTATWTANLSVTGNYFVDVIYVAGSNRATSAKYDISASGGTQTAYADQTQQSLVWVTLGSFNFSAGDNTVTLDAAGSTGNSVVIADAVRFRWDDGLGTPTPTPTPTPSNPAEMRVAIMVVYDDVNDTTSIQNWVDEIAGLNYNAIAIHSRYRGDATYFPNKVDTTYPNIEPRNSAAGSIDVLEEFTTRGQAAGLKVFAYVNAWLVTDGADTHPSPDHIVNTHPEWRTYAYNGGSPVMQTTAHEGEGLWIDPGVPGARAYLADVCGDIMMNYDCDGVILDRIRYPQTSWTRTNSDFGYHPDAIAAFNTQYSKSGVPDPYDTDWIEFRQDQITQGIADIYSRITSIDQNHTLLAFPIGRYNDAINFNYQNWPDWLNTGVMDGILAMNYTTDNGLFSSRCDEHIAAYSGERLVGMATSAYVSGADVDGQIQIVRDKGLDGVSPYRQGSMEALGYFTDLQNKWTGMAPWPDMPWKSGPTPTPTATPTPSPTPTETPTPSPSPTETPTPTASPTPSPSPSPSPSPTDTPTPTVSPTPSPTPEPSCHVAAIDCSNPNMGKGYKAAEATVTVVDGSGNPVANATVSGSFTGGYSESVSGATDANGIVVLQSSTTIKGGASFTFCVDDITHATLVYDSASNIETCDSF